MMKRTRVQAVVLMAFGALVGYAAAFGQLTAVWQAQAASPPRESPPMGEPRSTCCTEETDRGLLLAEADGRETRPQGTGQPGTDGKKPNILVHLRRRYRHQQHQRLQRRPDGLRDAQHRPHRQGRAFASCTITASKAAPRAVRRFSPASMASAPD